MTDQRLLTDGPGISRRELLESSSEIILILKNRDDSYQEEKSVDHFSQISMLVPKMPVSNMIKPGAFNEHNESDLVLEKEGTIL
jgi:hypothetical protein